MSGPPRLRDARGFAYEHEKARYRRVAIAALVTLVVGHNDKLFVDGQSARKSFLNQGEFLPGKPLYAPQSDADDRLAVHLVDILAAGAARAGEVDVRSVFYGAAKQFSIHTTPSIVILSVVNSRPTRDRAEGRGYRKRERYSGRCQARRPREVRRNAA